MTTCQRLASGVVELYFYGELEQTERTDVEFHLRSCTECRRAFEELSVIRAALAARPDIHAPAGDDWSAFMQRLDDAVQFERRVDRTSRADTGPEPRPGPLVRRRAGVAYAPYLAMAALLMLVASGLVFVARSTPRTPPSSEAAGMGTPPSAEDLPSASAANAARFAEAGFAALSEQHFERSKLVVLGLANKDPERADEADWAYERGLASSLLSDTRLYRLAAEDRGMKDLAGVMGDLELVLLQTALSEAPDGEALAQIQRLIHKRDLVTKMDVSATGS
jgi:hypothetical protein